MTTAARPTFEAARGGKGKGEGDLSALTKQYSSRDLPSHTKLKHRQAGQDSVDELHNKDFRKDLEDREHLAFREKNKERASRGGINDTQTSSKRPRIEQAPTTNLDADDPIDDEDADSDESDDEDDTAELLAELQRIKKERVQEESRKEQEKKVVEERIRMENIMSGNPLLNSQANFKVKRRWDDDVVFKTVLKELMRGKDKAFINDTLRSEFHKKFMEKYIH